MTAKGTFYVDYGDGTIRTIYRTGTGGTVYQHTYADAGSYEIKYGGIAATGAAYSKGYGNGTGAAISFNKNTNISSIFSIRNCWK